MRLPILLSALLLFALVSCSENPEKLFETAQFEEQQFNRDHAAQLYRQIIEQHPDTDLAQRARLRLKNIGKKQGE